ncbi:hypothetical protein ACYULU_09615 [Breznakiellaceae bacterium SP9]
MSVPLNTGKDRVTKIKVLYLVLAILAVFCGLCIYALFRNLNILLFNWFPKPAFLDTLYIPVNYRNPFVSFVLFNLPDSLWFLSGLLLIRSVWFSNKKWCSVYLTVFCLMACLFEISQLSKAVPGTFDIIDLSLLIPIAIGENIFYTFIRRRII